MTSSGSRQELEHLLLLGHRYTHRAGRKLANGQCSQRGPSQLVSHYASLVLASRLLLALRYRKAAQQQATARGMLGQNFAPTWMQAHSLQACH
jgi:hypothetical protein